MRISTTVRSAFDLRNCPIKDAAGRSIGRLRDIVFFANQGVVSYAVIGFGGLFGFGERLVAMPWTNLRISSNGKFLEVEESVKRQSADGRQSLNNHSSQQQQRKSDGRKQSRRKPKNPTHNTATSDDALIYRLFYQQDVAANGRIRSSSDSQPQSHNAEQKTLPAQPTKLQRGMTEPELPVARVQKPRVARRR